ncbi:MAG: hypothetical protein IPL69_09060 [Saprospiraceae bacterium]|nr:hypothetical protein [Candidatus Brachybacter algidus]
MKHLIIKKAIIPGSLHLKTKCFFSSLRESYQNDTIFDLIGKKDAFNTYDGLDLENIALAKSLAKNMVNNIPIGYNVRRLWKRSEVFYG